MKIKQKYWAWQLERAGKDYKAYLLAEESGYSSPLYKEILLHKIAKAKDKLLEVYSR